MDLVGKELGRYRVVSLLGAGGMGAVYDAIDSSLGRHVALKILPPHLLTDQSRVRRFIQEARSASSLNHPHLVAIYDIGTQSVDGADLQFIAMEKIDGNTLRENLAARQPTIKRALELMVQITDAVAAAHGAGVIHRDLKPENVMVSNSGYVKVLDFGLAKLIDDGSSSPSNDSKTAVMSTQSGVVVGTAGYMSPEQAAGRAVDHRSDIFALGCLLYEMTSGRRAFRGESTVDTLHKIIHDEPDPLQAIAPNTPAELQRIVRKALAKDPDERYQSARDLAIDLRGLLRDLESSPSTERAVAQRSPNRTFAIAATVAAIALLALAGWWLSRRANSNSAAMPARLEMQRLTQNGDTIHAAVSPDGKLLGYVVSNEKGQSLNLRQIATGQDLQLVPPQHAGFWGLSFTPDGNTIIYALKSKETPHNGAFFRVSTLGGTPEQIVEAIDCPPAISPDGKRLAWQRADFPSPGQSALMVANIDGSDAKAIATRRDPDQFAPLPFTSVAWSPDGKLIATPVARRTEGLSAKLLAVDAATGRETVISDGWWAVGTVAWLPDQSAILMSAIARDSPVPVPKLWEVKYPSGELRPITSDLTGYRSVSLTADGKSLVTVTADVRTNVSVMNVGDGSRPVRIADAKQDGRSGVTFTPKGEIVYSSTDKGFRLMVMNADGSGKRPLVKDVYQSAFPVAFKDGVVHGAFDKQTTMIRVVDLNGANPRIIVRGSDTSSIGVSPDGKWIAYSVNRQLYKSDMEGHAAPIAGIKGTDPSFSPDGKRIAYYDANEVVIIDAESGARVWGLPTGTRTGSTARFWPDGKSLVVTDYKDDRANLYRIDLGTNKAEKLTNFDELTVYQFSISQDGKMIAFARGNLTRDAVLVTGF